MFNHMTNHNQSITNWTTCNLVELIESVGVIGTKELIKGISRDQSCSWTIPHTREFLTVSHT